MGRMLRLVRKQGTGGRQHTVTITICEDPTPGTWGAHQLLLEEYKALDEEWIVNGGDSLSDRYKQLLFNTKFLEDTLAKYGELHCEYCGKQHLKIYHWKDHKGQADTATVDHFLPGSKYPELLWDVSNMRVSCMKCNTKKGTKVVSPDTVKFPYPR